MIDPDVSPATPPTELTEGVRSEEAYMELVHRFMGKQAAAIDEMRDLYHAASSGEVEFVAARQGGWAVKLAGRALESTYDPRGCAEELVAEQNLEDAALVVLIGAGGGAMPLALCQALEESPATQIIVLEPDQRILCGVFKHTEELEELNDERVAFFSSPQSMMLHISRVFRRRGRLLVVCPPSYRRVYGAGLRAIFKAIEDGVVLADVNKNTHSTRAQQWVRNLLRNIRRRSEHPSLFALEGRFSDVPAVVVAAGPSLDRNIHELRRVQDDVLIICVNTSLKALLRAGVRPHLVMSLESLNVSSHFKGDEDALRGLTLVLDETCHPSLFELPAERVYTFLESSPAFLAFAERAMSDGESRGVCVGGSIANAAFSCANMLGCDPIILIGQDLAYTNNQVYASGTVFEDITLDTSGEVPRLDDPTGIKQQILDDTDGGVYYAERSLFPVRSWDGEGTVLTSMDFNLFRFWFQEAGAQVKGTQGVTLINATEGGSYIEGFEHIPLAEALARHATPREGEALEAIIDTRHTSAALLPVSNCDRAVDSARRDCEQLKAGVERAVELLDEAVERLELEGAESEAFFRRLLAFEQVEQTLGELGRDNSLVEACIHQRLNTILDSRNPLKESDDPEEQWALHLGQSREVLEAILTGAESLLSEIEEASA
ncbi:MAG: hypothetical protein CMH57_05910 [Myxococcales bacterium]|nr:hypothetical protein [Myxococcales bacterium]